MSYLGKIISIIALIPIPDLGPLMLRMFSIILVE